MDDGPGCARHDVADRHAVDIGRDLNDAVGVMASQVGFDAVAHHNLRLVPRSPSRNQERQPDAVQLFSRYSWHAAASYSPWDHEALIFERADAYPAVQEPARVTRAGGGSHSVPRARCQRSAWCNACGRLTPTRKRSP